jgi:hypothetical protein
VVPTFQEVGVVGTANQALLFDHPTGHRQALQEANVVAACFAQLADREAVDRARLDRAAWSEHLANAWSPLVFLFAGEPVDGAELYARMFAPAFGIYGMHTSCWLAESSESDRSGGESSEGLGSIDAPRKPLDLQRIAGRNALLSLTFVKCMNPVAFGIEEDPATGSACAALVGVAAERATAGDGVFNLTVLQGVAMDRRSDISALARLVAGQVASVRVGGATTQVAEGAIEVAAQYLVAREVCNGQQGE